MNGSCTGFYDSEKIVYKIFENIGNISRCLRKENRQGVVELAPIFYALLMDFVKSLDLDMIEIMWLKYPNICPYCLRDEKCACIIAGKSKYVSNDARLDFFRNKTENQPKNTTEWQGMFKRIYGHINAIKPLTAVWLHLIEEVGELVHEFESENIDGIKEESADVMAWFFSFCTKLNLNIAMDAEVRSEDRISF